SFLRLSALCSLLSFPTRRSSDLVEFPVLVLQGRGIGGLRGLLGRGAEHIDLAPFDAQIPGVDVVEHLRQRVLRPGGAVGALVVGEDDESDGCIGGTVGHRIRFLVGVDLAEVGLLGIGDLGDDDIGFRTGASGGRRRLVLASSVDDEDHEHERHGDGAHRGGDPPAVLRTRCRMFGHVLTPELLRCLVNYRSSVFRVENCGSTAAAGHLFAAASSAGMSRGLAGSPTSRAPESSMWGGAPKSPVSGASSVSRICPSSADLVCVPSSSPSVADSVMTNPAPTAESSASSSNDASQRFVPSRSKPCSFEPLVTSVRVRESKPALSMSAATVSPESRSIRVRCPPPL